MERRDLKIQFRSVRFLNNSDARVIEYRVDPDQDITYDKEISELFGLVRRVVKREYSTRWIRPGIYRFYKCFNEIESAPVWTSEHNGHEHNLEWFKTHFKTIGDFEDWIEYCDGLALDDQKEYLKTIGPDIIY